MSFKGISWSSARSLAACAGLLFAGATLGVACLDYADENYGVVPCPTESTSSSASSSGTGTVTGSEAVESAQPDCDVPVPDEGSGSASG